MLAELLGSPVEIQAEGCIVTTDGGERYLDCGGHGVFLLGHRHPIVSAAVKAQLDRQPLGTRFLLNRTVGAAAAALAEAAPGDLDRVMFHGSGTEAVESAIKLARLAGRRRLVATEGGYHGKTMGALS